MTMETLKKRKRAPTKDLASKRSRSESSQEDDEQAQILLLEQEISASKKGYNNISKLLKLLQSSEPKSDLYMITTISLCRVFTRLLSSGELDKAKGGSEKELVVVQWLRERYTEYKTILLKSLLVEDVASTILTLCMRLLKTEGQFMRGGCEYSFPTLFLKEIISMLIRPEVDSTLRQEFSETYVEEHDDVRFYAFESIA